VSTEAYIRFIFTAKDQVGGAFSLWTHVQFFASKYLFDDLLPCIQVFPPSQPVSQLIAQRLEFLPGSHTALRLPPAQVDVETREVSTQRIYPGSRPVHIAPGKKSALNEGRALFVRHLVFNLIGRPVHEPQAQFGNELHYIRARKPRERQSEAPGRRPGVRTS
jgi:hypothetical protein